MVRLPSRLGGDTHLDRLPAAHGVVYLGVPLLPVVVVDVAEHLLASRPPRIRTRPARVGDRRPAAVAEVDLVHG